MSNANSMALRRLAKIVLAVMLGTVIFVVCIVLGAL